MKSLALETFYRDWARGEAKELSKVEAGYLLQDPVLHLATGPTSMLQPSVRQLSVQHLLHTRHPLGSGEEQKARDKEPGNFKVCIASDRQSQELRTGQWSSPEGN